MKTADCAKWMMDRHGISPEVARYLVENAGSDLYTLNNEIEKLETHMASFLALKGHLIGTFALPFQPLAYPGEVKSLRRKGFAPNQYVGANPYRQSLQLWRDLL
jgi:hypothetical protein